MPACRFQGRTAGAEERPSYYRSSSEDVVAGRVEEVSGLETDSTRHWSFLKRGRRTYMPSMLGVGRAGLLLYASCFRSREDSRAVVDRLRSTPEYPKVRSVFE